MKILANVFLAFSMILGLQAARLRWKLSYQRKADQQGLRQWYDEKWQRISASPWLELPEVIIAWLLRTRDSLAKRNIWRFFQGMTFILLPVVVISILWIHANQWHSLGFVDLPYSVFLVITSVLLYVISLLSALLNLRRLCLASIAILSGLGAFVVFFWSLDWNHKDAIALSVISAWLSVGLFERCVTYVKVKLSKDIPAATKAMLVLDLAVVTIIVIYVQKVWLDILTSVSVELAAIVAGVFLPFTGMVMAFVPAWLVGWVMSSRRHLGTTTEVIDPEVERICSMILLFGFAVAASFAVSLAALLIGHRLDPQAWIPQTDRLLWSNALCDGLTVIVSLAILGFAIPPRSLLSVPTAVALDFLLGMVLACASLWFGVKHLTLAEVSRVLLAHSTDGQRWEMGPYFWAMHTVFLPLLLYLLVVLICWAGKAIVEFRKWFYETAKNEEVNGLSMTAAFLGGMAVVLGALGTLVKWIV
jgi:hypothetical protein